MDAGILMSKAVEVEIIIAVVVEETIAIYLPVYHTSYTLETLHVFKCTKYY